LSKIETIDLPPATAAEWYQLTVRRWCLRRWRYRNGARETVITTAIQSRLDSD